MIQSRPASSCKHHPLLSPAFPYTQQKTINSSHKSTCSMVLCKLQAQRALALCICQHEGAAVISTLQLKKQVLEVKVSKITELLTIKSGT